MAAGKKVPPPKAGTPAHFLLLCMTKLALAINIAKLKKTRRPYHRFSLNGHDQNVTRRQALAWYASELERRP